MVSATTHLPRAVDSGRVLNGFYSRAVLLFGMGGCSRTARRRLGATTARELVTQKKLGPKSRRICTDHAVGNGEQAFQAPQGSQAFQAFEALEKLGRT